MNVDAHACMPQSIATVENDCALYPVPDRRQFHASGPVKAKIDANSFASLNNFSLCHRKMIRFQIRELAESLFDGFAKRGKVQSGRETNHKHPIRKRSMKNLSIACHDAELDQLLRPAGWVSAGDPDKIRFPKKSIASPEVREPQRTDCAVFAPGKLFLGRESMLQQTGIVSLSDTTENVAQHDLFE